MIIHLALPPLATYLRTLYDSTTMARIICSPYCHYGGINVSWIGLVCRPHTRLTNLGVLRVQASPKGKLHPPVSGLLARHDRAY